MSLPNVLGSLKPGAGWPMSSACARSGPTSQNARARARPATSRPTMRDRACGVMPGSSAKSSAGATVIDRRSPVNYRAMTHKGMKFGIFLAPFHRLGENPTLAMNRDMELIEWLDWLRYDEGWIGEAHPARWGLIPPPPIFLRAPPPRTKHNMLG